MLVEDDASHLSELMFFTPSCIPLRWPDSELVFSISLTVIRAGLILELVLSQVTIYAKLSILYLIPVNPDAIFNHRCSSWAASR